MSKKDTSTEEIERLAQIATASGREMAEELAKRIGVESLIEIWERHQVDVRAWAKAVSAAQVAQLDEIRDELETEK